MMENPLPVCRETIPASFRTERCGRDTPPSVVLVAKIVYGLHALSIVLGIVMGASILGAFLFGWPSIAAVVLNYALRGEAKGTYVESHFSWQIRTFWYAMLWAMVVALVGFLLAGLLVGFAIWSIGFVVMGIWVGYRIVRGWIRLVAGETMSL